MLRGLRPAIKIASYCIHRNRQPKPAQIFGDLLRVHPRIAPVVRELLPRSLFPPERNIATGAVLDQSADHVAREAEQRGWGRDVLVESLSTLVEEPPQAGGVAVLVELAPCP